jgi:hypothetical protein
MTENIEKLNEKIVFLLLTEAYLRSANGAVRTGTTGTTDSTAGDGDVDSLPE